MSHPIARFASFAVLFLPSLSHAQEASPPSETSIFLFNTLLLLAGGACALLVVAGLALAETGLVRAKNAAASWLKILAGVGVFFLTFWLAGYHLLFDVEEGGFLGTFAMWAVDDADVVANPRASAAHWFYYASALSIIVAIISGALAERLRIWPFLVFTAFFGGVICPILASWIWGGGYLAKDWGVVDLAGATVIHAAAGAAALTGALIIGPRRGKFMGARSAPMQGSNLPLAALGLIAIWIGWIGVVAAARGSLASVADAIAIAGMTVNIALAASGGALAAAIMTSLIYGKIDLTIVLNGAVGGLVSLAAEPLTPAVWQAVLIGAFGGVIVTASIPVLARFRIDDVGGAIPAHLFCGVWGALVAPWTNSNASLIGQTIGVGAVVAFAAAMSALLWIAIKFTIGARVTTEEEIAGLDRAALGLGADAEPRAAVAGNG